MVTVASSNIRDLLDNSSDFANFLGKFGQNLGHDNLSKVANDKID